MAKYNSAAKCAVRCTSIRNYFKHRKEKTTRAVVLDHRELNTTRELLKFDTEAVDIVEADQETHDAILQALPHVSCENIYVHSGYLIDYFLNSCGRANYFHLDFTVGFGETNPKLNIYENLRALCKSRQADCYVDLFFSGRHNMSHGVRKEYIVNVPSLGISYKQGRSVLCMLGAHGRKYNLKVPRGSTPPNQVAVAKKCVRVLASFLEQEFPFQVEILNTVRYKHVSPMFWSSLVFTHISPFPEGPSPV
ncbi:hypothetical protein KDA11_04365 [Candidatus Saccharibacteria bacterium]|nr:hypothetical protein [Candidatus Saccharibacteria bacterium]